MIAVEPRVEARTAGEIEGGYVTMSIGQMLMAWWMVKLKVGRLENYRPFRVYLALHEVMRGRKAAVDSRKKKKRDFGWSIAALADAVHEKVGGGGGQHIRSDLRAWLEVGAVVIDDDWLRFANGPSELKLSSIELNQKLRDVLGTLEDNRMNVKRFVPFASRFICYLASHSRSTEAATALCIGMRCLFLQPNRKTATFEGLCRDELVTLLFGIGERQVKEARSRLQSSPCPWLTRNGIGWAINLEWRREQFELSTAEEEAGQLLTTKSAPLEHLPTSESALGEAQFTTKSAPPLYKKNKTITPSDKNHNSQRIPAGGHGVLDLGKEKKYRPKRFRRYEPDELDTPWGIEAIFRELVSDGVLIDNAEDRILCYAFAARSRRTGKDPGACFAVMIHAKRFHERVSGDEERAAMKRIRWFDEKRQAA